MLCISNILLKLLLTFMTFHGYHATDLYSWTPPQTFTVGELHSNVNARSPHPSMVIAWADPNDCGPIGPEGGIGNFISYDTY